LKKFDLMQKSHIGNEPKILKLEPKKEKLEKTEVLPTVPKLSSGDLKIKKEDIYKTERSDSFQKNNGCTFRFIHDFEHMAEGISPKIFDCLFQVFPFSLIKKFLDSFIFTE